MGEGKEIKGKDINMATYDAIPTSKLSNHNELVSVTNLPELVHMEDSARTVFVDFSRTAPVTITPDTPIDEAIQKMKLKNAQMLLVVTNGHVTGLISQEDLLSEQPMRLMRQKRLNRNELTVDMLMIPQKNVLVIDHLHLKNTQVGHVINTLKSEGVYYILVIKKSKSNKHLIKGLFSASQIGRQLHVDLSSILTKSPETILELQEERKV
jgi:signal-transduction protein with cAMP-binding, CBS, and nucleotidyltransferase domain